jgi:hypothetical protein
MKLLGSCFLTLFLLPGLNVAQDPQFTGKYFHILLSTKDFKAAQQLAQTASKKTGLSYRGTDLQPNAITGVTHHQDSCKKWGEEYPCYFPRGRYDDGAYISVEYSNGFEGFMEGYYIVIAVSGSKEDPEFTNAVKKVKAYFPKSYVKKTRVFIGCMH